MKTPMPIITKNGTVLPKRTKSSKSGKRVIAPTKRVETELPPYSTFENPDLSFNRLPVLIGTETSIVPKYKQGKDKSFTRLNGSIAIGDGTTVIGQDSVAVGINCVTYDEETNPELVADEQLGDNTAIGTFCRAHGTHNLAVGSYAKVTDKSTSGIAIGANALATKDWTTSLGSNSSAQGTNATAIGNQAHAKGLLSTVIGTRSTADNYGSLCAGSGSNADGVDAIAIKGTVKHDFSAAIGKGAITTKPNQIRLGCNTVYTDQEKANHVEVGIEKPFPLPELLSEVVTTATIISENGDITANKGNMVAKSFQKTLDPTLIKSTQSLTLGLDFIKKLNPIQVDTQDENTNSLTTRLGVLPVDLFSVLDQKNQSYAMIQPSQENQSLLIDYTEMVAPIVKAIQELEKSVQEIKAAAAPQKK